MIPYTYSAFNIITKGAQDFPEVEVRLGFHLAPYREGLREIALGLNELSLFSSTSVNCSQVATQGGTQGRVHNPSVYGDRLNASLTSTSGKSSLTFVFHLVIHRGIMWDFKARCTGWQNHSKVFFMMASVMQVSAVMPFIIDVCVFEISGLVAEWKHWGCPKSIG